MPARRQTGSTRESAQPRNTRGLSTKRRGQRDATSTMRDERARASKPRGQSGVAKNPSDKRGATKKPRGQRALLDTYERLARARTQPQYVFTLYVTGASTHSLAAIRNLRRLCACHFADAEIKVIDILRNPTLAGAAHILASPTLVRSSPPPVLRVVGDLSDEARVLRGLGIKIADADGKKRNDASERLLIKR